MNTPKPNVPKIPSRLQNGLAADGQVEDPNVLDGNEEDLEPCMVRRQAILESLRKVDTLPTAGIKLVPMLQRGDCELSEIARIIRTDPSLTANVLRAANAAAEGKHNKIESIDQAIVRLGIKKMLNVVLAVCTHPMLGKPVSGYDLPSGMLWQRAYAMAVAAEEIAQMALPSFTAAFTAGLLADIGKLVLGDFVNGDVSAILDHCHEHNASFDEAELIVLGIDHAQTGQILLEQWGLPEVLTQAVGHHHCPEQAPEAYWKQAALLHLADYAVCLSGIGGGLDGMQFEVNPKAYESFGINEAQISRLLCQVVDTMAEADLFELETTPGE